MKLVCYNIKTNCVHGALMSNLEVLGENIRNLRKRKNISQEKLAEMCNLHRTYIGAIECGTKNVCFKNLIKIIGALDCNVNEIFQGIDFEEKTL